MLAVYLILVSYVGAINTGHNKSPIVEVKGKSYNEVMLKVNIPTITYSYFQLGGQKFIRFNLKDIGVLHKVGKPEVPAIRRFIEVPEGAHVNYEILDMKVQKLQFRSIGISEKLMPSYPPVPKIEGEKPKLVVDEEVYGKSSYWPEKVVNIKKAGVVRGHNLYLLEIFPVRYNPVENEVEYVTDMEIRIRFAGGNAAATTNKIERFYSPLVELSLKEKVVNYGVYEDFKLNPQVPVGYLIITPSQWVDELQPLIDWKKEKGYHITVATIPDSISNGDTINVRNYIINAYQNWSVPPTFVLLVGDVNEIQNFTSSESYNPANDLKYEAIDGNDYFPDLYVGRFSAQDESDVITMVTKTVNYERVVWSQGKEWVQKAYFMATDDGGNHGVAEGTHLYCMGIVRNHGMIADSLFEYYGTGTPVATAFNDGRSLATYSGHGYEDGWAGPDFTSSDISNLTNTDKYPLVQSYACLTGAYTESECFMEAWVRAPGKGAVTSFGSSVYSYWDEDDILQRRVFDEIFDTGYVWVKGAINEGKYDLYLHYGGAGRTHSYYQQYNLFGDPSLYLFTNIPNGVVVDHPAVVPLGSGQIQVTVTDSISNPIEGALVAVRQGGILFDAQYTDAAGLVTLNINPTVVDTIWVTATGYNIAPHNSFIMVQTSGPYVSYLSSEVDDGAGNGNGRINPGESIDLEIWVKNWGSDAATDVYGKLSTTNTNVTITSDSVYYGASIAAGDSTSGMGVFSFDVSLNATDQEVIPFALEVHAAESTWTSNFNLVIYAPVLEFDGVVVVDTFPGCNGNGYVDPGERVSLVVGIRNTGHEVATSVSADISTSHSGVVINDGSSGFGDIEPDSVVFGEAYDVSFDGSLPVGERVNFDLSMLSGGQVFSGSFDLYVGIQYYSTDFEGQDTSSWVGEGAWHLTTRSYHSGSHSYWCGNESTGEYDNDQDISLYMPPFIALENETLRFWTWYDLESGYDYGYVEVSTDGKTWTQVASYNGSSGGWVEEVLPITQVALGEKVKIRFRFVSDGSVRYDGWYIDDIQFGPVVFIPGMEVEGYDVVFDDNSNGVIDAGENVGVVINLKNVGLQDAHNVEAILRSLDQDAQVVDSSSSYGDILSMSVSSGDTFTFVVSSSPSDRLLSFRLYITGDNIEDSLDIEVCIGHYVGPSSYGYYAYSDLSPYDNAPTFEWVEVSDIGTVVANDDDSVEVLSLPFTFRYFGNNYTGLSVSSNGWIGFGSYTNAYYSNGDIPSTESPNNIIAGVWDDLNPTGTGSGKVYYYYDDANHRFIVEWDSVYHYGSSSPEKFEIILYDPAHYTTPTGDGEIVVQYLISPTQDDFSMGIENADGSDGIGYYIDGVYGESADEIVAGRVIKFTTNEPLTGVGEDLVSGLPRRFELFAPYPNPLRGEAHVRFALPRRTKVELSVYDIQGRRVKVLAHGVYEAGYHVVRFDGRDSRGRRLSQGIYFLRLKAGDYRRTRKMVLVR